MIIIQVTFTKEEREELRKKYHFEEKNRKQWNQMIDLLSSLVRAKAWYRVFKAGEIEEMSDSCCMAAVVTLSEYTDRLIALESEAGNLLDAYMLDCIALEFLNVAYRKAAKQIYQETQLWQGECQFFGEQLSLERLPFFLEKILEKFPDMPVRQNASGMMTPLKSVVYLAELRKEQSKDRTCSGSICLGCRNVECAYRRERK